MNSVPRPALQPDLALFNPSCTLVERLYPPFARLHQPFTAPWQTLHSTARHFVVKALSSFRAALSALCRYLVNPAFHAARLSTPLKPLQYLWHSAPRAVSTLAKALSTLHRCLVKSGRATGRVEHRVRTTTLQGGKACRVSGNRGRKGLIEDWQDNRAEGWKGPPDMVVFSQTGVDSAKRGLCATSNV